MEVSVPPDFSSRIIRFSTFELNLHTGELRQRGQKVKLQEQPLQVLAALLEQPGEIVTREELRNKLWPADTFVDFDHSLNAAIRRLRDALGESAERPIFVETVARRGYRFIAPVDGGSAASAIGVAASPERSKSPFLAHWLIIVSFTAIVISILAWTAWRHPSHPGELIERKLTSNSSENSVSSAAISRDGKYLAYADNSGCYLKQIRTGEAHSLPLPPNFSARVDDWFPDGSHLLVSREAQPGTTSLWSISIFGGSPRQLADDASGGSVSPDGSHIAFRRGALTYDGLWAREEWVMRSDGTDPVKVAADKSDGSEVGAPTWSPDGKRIAYLRSSWAYNMSTNSIEVNEWQKARADTLVSDRHLIVALQWLPDGRLIYAPAGHSSLWTVTLPRSGKIPEPPRRIATTEHGSISRITGSADGKALIFLRANSLPSIYIGTLAEDGTKLLAHTRLTLDESVSLAWSWTPDSKAVLLFSDRNGTSEMFKQTADQPLAESLMVGAGQLSAFRVTPDGSEILYISTPRSASPETSSSIFAIPTDGGTPRLVLKDARIWNLQCARLPSRLCLYSVTKGNTMETYQFDVKSGKSTDPPQIDSPIDWSLSPDGSQLAIIVRHPNQRTIQLRSTSTGKTRDLVVEGWSGLMGADWSADGRSLFTTSHSHEGDSTLLNVTLDGRASVLLHSRNEVYSAIPSPDGRSLAITEDSGAKNVWQIENF